MILDPDEPLPQARTARQSLIRTERGWVVLGQPTAAAETIFQTARAELAELTPKMPGHLRDLRASMIAVDVAQQGATHG